MSDVVVRNWVVRKAAGGQDRPEDVSLLSMSNITTSRRSPAHRWFSCMVN